MTVLLPVAPLVAAVPELGAGCGAGRLPSHGGRPHEPPAETVHLTVPSPCSSGDASDPPPEPRAQRERQRPSVGPAPTCGRGEVGWRHGAVRGGRVAASWHRESCQIQARCLDQAAKERDPHRREPFIQPA